MTDRRTIALVGRGSPESPAALVGVFARLLDRGFDAHLLCDGGDPEGWPGMSELPGELVSVRVHPPPRGAQQRAPSAPLVRALAGEVVRHPWAAARVALAGGRADRVRLGDRYLDAVLLALAPRLVHFTTPSSALRRSALCRAIGSKVLVSYSDADLDRVVRSGRRALRRAWRSADVLVFPNPSVRERARELGCPADLPTASIMRGPDPDWFRGEPADADGNGDRPLRVLSAGPLSWRHGLEHAVQSVRLLLDRGVDCEYRVAGDGDFEPAIGFARHQLGVEPKVTILDAPDRDALREQLAWADVFLAPAVAPERTALAEAQAMAVPAVATDRAAPPGVRLSAAGGIEVPPRDPAALADALSALAADPALRRRLGQAARAHAVEAFGADRDSLRLYADALGEP